MSICFKHLIILLATLAAGIALVGQGCGNFEAVQSKQQSSSSSSLSQDFVPQPETQTASIAYARQILDSMLACTGVGTADDKIREEYNSRKGSLSEYGYATEVTGPMLMSVTAVAGEVCNKLVDSEMNSAAEQRRIFSTVDFDAGASSLSRSQLESSITRLARSCWQREQSAEESEVIVNAVNQAFGTSSETKSTHTAMVMVCTGMLSSLSSISM